MLNRFKSALALLIALLLAFALPGFAAAETAADERDLTPLPDEWFDDAVFLGDSVSYTLASYCEMTGDLGDAMFFSERSFNLRGAVGGANPVWYQGRTYYIQDLLEELGRDKVFMMFGINDIGQDGGIDLTMELWDELCARIEEKCPGIRIYLQSCLPMWHVTEHDGFTNDAINRYNERLRAFCEEKGYVFVYLSDAFRNENGTLEELYSADHYVHVNEAAAVVWVEQLRDPANYSVDPRSY